MLNFFDRPRGETLVRGARIYMRAIFYKQTTPRFETWFYKKHKRIEKQGCNSIIGCNVSTGQLYCFINQLAKVIKKYKGEKND
jgi:hypothetical protein